MSLQDLMKVTVTSVSKQRQELASAAAAIFVISHEDIERSGATTIPDLLRMVPGLEVARIDANSWAVSSRGFNSRFANKLLVLIDGRSVYTPLFSGVFWDRQEPLLEDIDRIEVIRGPGASLWGANAVNGVINIITRPATETKGTYLEARTGNEELGFLAGRQGGALGDRAAYRTYLKLAKRDGGTFASGADGKDGWEAAQGGFRADGTTRGGDSWRAIGDFREGVNGESFPFPSLTAPYSTTLNERTRVRDGDLLLGWRRPLGGESELGLRFYYDHAEFNDLRISDSRDTADIELEHHFSPLHRHSVVWGFGYRLMRSDATNSFNIALTPSLDTEQLASAFVQDTISLLPNQLALTLGSKFEYNTFTQFNVQPSGRIAWQPTPDSTLWAAVSRAVRTPSEAENDLRLNQQVIAPFGPGNPTPLPAVVAILGQTGIKPEELTAYEAGTRFAVSDRLSFDLSAYYNDYDNVVAVNTGSSFLESSPAPTHLVVPLYIQNQISGHTYGLEALANWRPFENWRLQPSYSYIHFDLTEPPGVTPANMLAATVGQSPHHQFKIRSLSNLTDDITFDSMIRYITRLSSLSVGGYIGVDARLAYKFAPGAEAAIVGQNLFYSHRFEFGSETTLATVPTAVDRSVFVTLKMKF
jgi:iron complex outermembrane receptor protein